MRLILLINLLFITGYCTVTSHIKETDIISVVDTPRDLFYDILKVFKFSKKLKEDDYMEELFSIRNNGDFDDECHQILSDIIRARDRSSNLKVVGKRDHRIRTKLLEKFVQTYINYEVSSSQNSSKEKLTKTLFALRAQEITNTMIAEKSLWSILKHIKIKLAEYDLIEDERETKPYGIEPEDNEGYIVSTVLRFAKGIIVLGVCSVLNPALCLGIVGSLLFIQVLLWMLILTGYLATRDITC